VRIIFSVNLCPAANKLLLALDVESSIAIFDFSTLGIIDLLKQKAYEYDGETGKGKEVDIPADMQDQVEMFREKLVEKVAEQQDDLIEKYFEEGDEVNVIALDYDKKKRHLSLSIKDANPDPWENINEILGVGDTVTATVSNIEPYGVFVDLGEDLEAFLHVSEVSWDKNVKHPKDYLTVGEDINVEVIEIDNNKRRLRVSLKSLQPKPMEAFSRKHRVGDVVTGTVTSLTDFGAFVKLDGVEGLLHNQETSWDKSKNAKDLFKSGDEVEVKIIKIDTDAGKISLSKKALEESPADAFAKSHKNGDIVTGTVKDKKDFGVFIALDANVDALIRTEDLHPLKFDEIEPGQEIKGVISFIDAKNDRIRVSVKRLERQEEREALQHLNDEQDDSMTLGDLIKDKLK
jgi:small subunit ribosomal protein S1